ncbi:MAG: GldG family protein, partial [Rhodothermales bacterium]|nr:GldG family protein [Rhodothermales bacterium]
MKRDWTSRSAILLVALILVAINLAGLNLFARVDLTDDNVYSLADASIDLVENLEDPVTVTAFFTDDLPAPYSGNRRFLKDKLDDYAAYGGQNFQYRFVDPATDADTRTEVQRYRIPPVQIQVIEQDNVQLKNAYMGVAIEYAGEREIIPVVQDLSTLEYDITSAMRRLTRETDPVVGFLTGHGEPSIDQEMSSLRQGLSRNYDVRSVEIEDGELTTVPDVLMVVAPTDTLGEAELRALDDYVMQGGRLGLLLNRVSANLQAQQASALDIGLDPWLESYGIRVSANLIMDESSSVVTVQRRQSFFNLAQQIPYPFFPVVTRFDDNNMMVNRLRELAFYFASSIDTSLTVPEGVDREILFTSSQNSTVQQNVFFIQPVLQQNEFDFDGGPYPMAMALRGSFPSAFDDGLTGVESRIVVVGDGDFVNETMVGQIPNNTRFVLNMVDWLVQDDGLLTIRAKSIAPRRLDDVPDAWKPVVKYANLL